MDERQGGGRMWVFVGCALALIACSLLSGCGVGAAVHMKDGSSHRGKLDEGDRTTIRLRVKKRPVVLCKRDVADVDHAGNVGAIAGVVVVAAGAVLLGATAAQPEPRDPVGFLVGGLTVAGGTVLAVHGTSVWLVAKERSGWPPDEVVAECRLDRADEEMDP